jgi:RluA family pseudouridine synthase
MNVPIIFEDEWILVVDKPAGLLTVPVSATGSRSLTGILNNEHRKKDTPRFYPCHRLDRDTSGLIIYAKGKSVQKKMMELFAARQVDKFYIAFIQGRLSSKTGKFEKKIENKQALTAYRCLETRNNFTVVEARPGTGRKNQIRIHFASSGHPLVGEDRFAFRRDFALRGKRAFLHAVKLGFRHPVTGEQINLSVDLAADMKNFLEKHQ